MAVNIPHSKNVAYPKAFLLYPISKDPKSTESAARCEKGKALLKKRTFSVEHIIRHTEQASSRQELEKEIDIPYDFRKKEANDTDADQQRRIHPKRDEC